MMKKAWSYISDQALPLKVRLYFSFLIWGVIITTILMVCDWLEGSYDLALLNLFGGTVCICTLILVIKRVDLLSQTAVVIVVLLNLIIMPVTYFSSGGILTGAILFFPIGIIITGIFVEEKLKKKLIYISIAMEAIVLLIIAVNQSIQSDKRIDFILLIKVFILTFGALIFMAELILNIYGEYSSEYEKTVRQKDEYYYSSILDPLTQIYNRGYILARLGQLIHGNQCDFSIVIFDVDLFKKINDNYGHLVGDEVLKNLTALVSEELREKDILARYGGEEFIICLRHTNEEEARIIANRLKNRVVSTNLSNKIEEKVTISGGISTMKMGMSVDDLIQEADVRLYTAKRKGRNNIC